MDPDIPMPGFAGSRTSSTVALLSDAVEQCDSACMHLCAFWGAMTVTQTTVNKENYLRCFVITAVLLAATQAAYAWM